METEEAMREVIEKLNGEELKGENVRIVEETVSTFINVLLTIA
jgi:hypothetical protein